MLTFMREASEPAQTPRSIVDEFGVERPSVHERLQRLADEGRVERGRLSPRVVIWWGPDDEE